jgi:hypothetical protein
MCRMWVGTKRVIANQINSNLRLLSEPLAQLSVIELKALRDTLCDSFYDVEVHCIIVMSKEL